MDLVTLCNELNNKCKENNITSIFCTPGKRSPKWFMRYMYSKSAYSISKQEAQNELRNVVDLYEIY